MKTKSNFKDYLVIICFFLLILMSCRSDKAKLTTYYLNNKLLHQEISDSLMSFCKKYKTEVKLAKSNLQEHEIRFDILFQDSAEFIPVYFDSVFTRHEYRSDRTEEFEIPKIIIEKFKAITYRTIGADSNLTFFAYKWDKPKYLIGTSPDSQIGVLILQDTTGISKRRNPISSNACIAHYSVY